MEPEIMERGIAFRHRRGGRRGRRHRAGIGGGYDPRVTCPCCKRRYNVDKDSDSEWMEEFQGRVCGPCYKMLEPRLKEAVDRVLAEVREARQLENLVTPMEAK